MAERAAALEQVAAEHATVLDDIATQRAADAAATEEARRVDALAAEEARRAASEADGAFHEFQKQSLLDAEEARRELESAIADAEARANATITEAEDRIHASRDDEVTRLVEAHGQALDEERARTAAALDAAARDADASALREIAEREAAHLEALQLREAKEQAAVGRLKREASALRRDAAGRTMADFILRAAALKRSRAISRWHAVIGERKEAEILSRDHEVAMVEALQYCAARAPFDPSSAVAASPRPNPAQVRGTGHGSRPRLQRHHEAPRVLRAR